MNKYVIKSNDGLWGGKIHIKKEERYAVFNLVEKPQIYKNKKIAERVLSMLRKRCKNIDDSVKVEMMNK